MDTVQRARSRSRVLSPSPIPHSRNNYFIGIVLLIFVVLLWTFSNFITQDLYEIGYNKPFLVTYMNTSSFALYLIPLLIRRWWSKSGNDKSRIPAVDRSIDEYQPLVDDEPIEYGYSPESRMAFQPLPPLTDKQTASLAFTFCLIWFAANWSVNASLGYTSVASATILSSMSGFFTLAIGRLFRVETLSLVKIGAVIISFTGVILVSISDSVPTQSIGPESSFNSRVNSVAFFGDALALLSAMFYAMYVILLKVRIKSESRINMQLFFGFVGLFNIIVCFPLGVILHLTGAEIFELPPSRKILSTMLVNMAITLSSDYIYVLAMLKTTPLVVTIGLSLTIPVAVLGDFLLLKPSKFQVIFGALLVLCSFVAIGFEDAENQEETIAITGAHET
uniref:EamA domain-containing protein n=1 Tax=Psilocybe cubensis TaxID=181762 RepID=A0A8H8CRK7_PSICU